MKRYLIILFCCFSGFLSAQLPDTDFEIESDTLVQVRWDTTSGLWLEERNVTYTLGFFINYAFPVANNIDVASDSTRTWEHYFNRIESQYKKERGAIRNLLTYNGNKEENLLDSILFKILQDSVTYEKATLKDAGNKYHGIWKDTKQSPVKYFEFKDASQDERIRIIEVEDDGSGGWQNVSGGDTGNARVKANNYLKINSIYTESTYVVKLDSGTDGKTIFQDINKIVRLVKIQ